MWSGWGGRRLKVYTVKALVRSPEPVAISVSTRTFACHGQKYTPGRFWRYVVN